MFCNIDEAFGENSIYIKNVLDNELNNEKLLDRYKNFDTYFQKPKIIEHFTDNTNNKSPMTCSNIVDHVLRCSDCRNNIVKKYINNILNISNINGIEMRKILSIVLIILLILIVIKLLWKL